MDLALDRTRKNGLVEPGDEWDANFLMEGG